jgi:hypothetical protein
VIDDMRDFKDEMKLLTIFRAATNESPRTFVKVCRALGMEPHAAAATFDPTKIDDADARIHVIRIQAYLAKAGWKRTLGIG